MVSHTWHSIEPILDRNDSPLHCLHCALVYRYYFRMEETWNHVFVHRQLDKYQVWAICFMCWMPDSNAGPKVSRQLSQPLLSWKLWKCTLCRHRVHFQSFHHKTDITPRLDNCNNLLCGLSIEITQNLQRCQEHSYTAGLQEPEIFLIIQLKSCKISKGYISIHTPIYILYVNALTIRKQKTYSDCRFWLLVLLFRIKFQVIIYVPIPPIYLKIAFISVQ